MSRIDNLFGNHLDSLVVKECTVCVVAHDIILGVLLKTFGARLSFLLALELKLLKDLHFSARHGVTRFLKLPSRRFLTARIALTNCPCSYALSTLTSWVVFSIRKRLTALTMPSLSRNKTIDSFIKPMA